jgi:hypothetical protein
MFFAKLAGEKVGSFFPQKIFSAALAFRPFEGTLSPLPAIGWQEQRNQNTTINHTKELYVPEYHT